MDFVKAFDSVSHYRLFVKLMSYGIHAPVLTYIASFLSNRKLCVQMNSINSTWENVANGDLKPTLNCKRTALLLRAKEC